jgi:hypothetical protein
MQTDLYMETGMDEVEMRERVITSPRSYGATLQWTYLRKKPISFALEVRRAKPHPLLPEPATVAALGISVAATDYLK